MKLFLSIFLTLAIFAVATLGVSKKRSFNFSTSWGKRAATGSSKPDMESGAKGQNQKCSFNFSSSWGKRAGKTSNSESAGSPKPEMKSENQKRSYNFWYIWRKRVARPGALATGSPKPDMESSKCQNKKRSANSQNQRGYFNFSHFFGKWAASRYPELGMESAKCQNQKLSFNFSSSWGKRASKTTNIESTGSPNPEMESSAKGRNQKRSFNFSSAWGKRAATKSSEPEMESAKGQNQKRSFNFSSSWGKRASKTTNIELAGSPKPETESAAKGQKQKRSFNFSSAWGKRAATGSPEPEMESAKGQNQKRSFNFSSSWGKRAGKTTNSESESINDYALIDQTYLEQLIAKQNVSKSSHFFKKNNYNT